MNITISIKSRILFLLIFLLLTSIKVFGQKSVFKSSLDESVSIRSILLIPITDNTSGIYAKPLSDYLFELLSQDKQWEPKILASDNKFDLKKDSEITNNKIKSILKDQKVDSIITGRVSKGSMGISIQLTLYVGREGLPLASENLIDLKGFEIDEMKNRISQLYTQIKSKIPYNGEILSRKGNLVTLNIGKNQGIGPDTEINVIQITKIQRHPKFKFIIQTENEILGRVVLVKVEDFLSFGSIISEREENLIKAKDKLIVTKFVSYPKITPTADGKFSDALASRQDSAISLGKDAKEWIPASAPTFGKIALMLGLTQNSLSNQLSTSGGISSDNIWGPSINFTGELWLSSIWFTEINLRQYIHSMPNTLPSSTPSALSAQLLETSLSFGYNLLLQESFYGPKFQLLGGISSFDSSIDQSSPAAFNRMNYSGFSFGLGLIYPLNTLKTVEHWPLQLGTRFGYFISPSVSESPTTSGSSSTPRITRISFFGSYEYSSHYNFISEINWLSLMTSFSGTGSRSESATTSSQKMMTLSFGMEYLF